MNQTKPIDEIIQNIKDDAIADHKGWQGSPYEARQELADLLLGLPSLRLSEPTRNKTLSEKYHCGGCNNILNNDLMLCDCHIRNSFVSSIRQEIAEALGVEP